MSANPWAPKTPKTIPLVENEETRKFFEERAIAHYRKHGKATIVHDYELAKMKEWGLYREGDELLTVDFYGGDFIVLRDGAAVRVKYGPGSAAAELEEAVWMMNARGR